MKTFRRPLFFSALLIAILTGCAGTQSNTTQTPTQAANAQPQPQPTNVPF